MRKVVVVTFVSLDGVMQAPGSADEDRDGGFAHGGWLVPHFDAQLGARMVELVQRAGGLLLGRKTYDIFAASWPNMPEGDPIAAVYNRIPKYVASRSPVNLTWADSHQFGADIPGEVARLRADGSGELQVPGCGDFVQTLLRHNLVDEFHLTVFPSILGTGKRLFGNGTMPRGLALRSSATTATGVVMLHYERVGDLRIGEFGPEIEEAYR